MTYSGNDPFYNANVKAFKQGAVATLNLVVTNNDGQYLNVTGAAVQFDYNANYTAAGVTKASPIRINNNNQATILIQFTVPAATNLVTHSYTITLNYTLQFSPGVNRQQNVFGSGFAIYSSDQATAISEMQQLGLLNTFGLGTSLCGSFGTSNFKTARGNALCQQAQQQAVQGMQQYATGDFANSKNTLQNAVNNWNQAVAVDSGQGLSTDLIATTGTFLLGVGAAIASFAAIFFVFKRRPLPIAPAQSK
jgi:hypothetical protein